MATGSRRSVVGARTAYVALVTLAACASSPTPTPTRTPASASAPPTLGDATAAAAIRHQPMIAEFGAPWCQPCRAFAEHVLTEPRVAAALRGVTFVQYDIETPVGRDAAALCKIAGVPAVVGVGPDGGLHPMTSGTEPTADEFLAFIASARAARE